MKKVVQVGLVAIATELFLLSNLNVYAEDTLSEPIDLCGRDISVSGLSNYGYDNGCDIYGNSDLDRETVSEIPRRTRAEEVEQSIREEIEEEIRLGEMELLAQLIEAEAGNQDYEGKRLVADVVLNRIDSGRFENSIESVIFESGQFSCIADGGFDKAAWHISEDSFKASKQEYEAGKGNRLDNTILFFTAGYYNPYCVPMYRHGDHYFGR